MRSLLCAAAAAALRPRVAVRRGSVPSLVYRARNDASSCAGAPSIAARAATLLRAEAVRRRRCSAPPASLGRSSARCSELLPAQIMEEREDEMDREGHACAAALQK